MRARKPVRGAPPGAATWPQGQEVPLRPQELTPAGHQETLTWKPREAAGTAGGAGGEGAGGAQWAPPPPGVPRRPAVNASLFWPGSLEQSTDG